MSAFFRVDQLGREGLEPSSFQLERAEISSLAGPSGSGKTLLLRALADLDESHGRVELEGRPRETFDAPEWRRRVGLLPAEPGWWAPTVREHFIEWDRIDPARLGLPPSIGEAPVSRLSTGERQRLALLRLLEGEPDVLLLDEPTSALDADSTAAVESLISERRARGTAVLWAGHDKEQALRVASRRFEIVSGRLREIT